MNLALHAVTFDCADPDRLARFWSAALGLAVDDVTFPGIVTLGASTRSPFYVFQKLAELPSGRNRTHVDFETADLDAETRRLIDLGATVLAEVAENDVRFTTFADPEANKFDVVAS